MVVGVGIKCGQSGKVTDVSKYNALKVFEDKPPLPPTGTPNKYRFFRAFVGSTGADSGTTNMNVNGATTSQTFYIEADDEADIYIRKFVVIIADSSVSPNKFGAISKLTNGVDIIVKEANTETYIINGAKTAGELIAFTGVSTAWGDGLSAFELQNWSSLDDANVIPFDVTEAVPGGIRIGRGTTERFKFVVNDNLTGLDELYCYVLGYKHYDI